MKLPPVDVPALLRQHRLFPDKSLGQNFLLDESALQQVVEAADVTPDDIVLEIGAGLGSLTRYLANSARLVVAVELDHRLISPLNQVVGQFSNVQIIEGDILTMDPVSLVSGSDYLVVANIPYYITSPLIRHLLEARMPPHRLILTIQREVAERICSLPGEMNLLALSVQVYGHPQIVSHIPASAFYPSPNVDSAILRIDLFASPLIPVPELDTYFPLIKAGFSQKRKTLRNSLSAGLRLPPATIEAMLIDSEINPMRRAETLDIDEWHRLSTRYLAQSRSIPG